MDSDATVGDVITREYVGVSESDAVDGTVGLMREEQVSSAIVLRGTDPVGIVTEWDVLSVVDHGIDPGSTPVSEIMSTPVRSVRPDVTLVEAADVMSSQNIRNLLVEDADGIAGVLTDRDFIAAFASLRPTTVGGTGAGTGGRGAEAGDENPAGEDGVDGYESSATPAATDPEYSTQGVCEVCGSLAVSLDDHNGRVVCSDCRDVS